MLQELTNKIKKIIPEIDELKFGCRVEFENFKQTLKGTVCYGDDILTIIRPDGDNVYERDKEDLKIIGRDITLEDVLRCLEEKFKDNDYCKKRKSVYNAFSCFEVVRMWKLGSPLHEQSEETIKELNKLIC